MKKKRTPFLLTLILCALPAFSLTAQQVPHPRDVFGFEPGADYQIADYSQMLEYYRQLDAASDRVQMIEFGRSALGKPMLLLFISSEENLRQLDRWRDISARLARARVSDQEARQLAAQGKAVVWIDGGMHATERAHAQMTSLLAHKVVTEESEEMRAIRDNVILLLNPVINPDGLDIVANWYKRNRGTPFETTGPPELYHHYVGHDNNRDWYMILQPETQAVSRVLYHEWYPQIVYNHHQTSPDWTRIFVPPFADPVNPNIPADVITGVNLVGNHMVNRFSEEEKDGVISRVIFSMWWNGGGRTTPYYHNMIGILTETGQSSPTPRFWDPEERPDVLPLRRSGTISTTDPSIFYPDPWPGGWLRFRDAIDYMLTGSMAVLDIGAKRRQQWLYNMYRMGRDAIERGEAGGPFAYVVPPDQWDRGESRELVNTLLRGGVEVHRATSEFTAGGERYPRGSYVIHAGQAFRPYLVDLMERQDYPDRRLYEGGPPETPYDLAGWTLPIQMGVKVARIEEPFQTRTELVEMVQPVAGQVMGNAAFGYALSHQQNLSARAVNRLLAAGDNVFWTGAPMSVGRTQHPAGTIVIEAGQGTTDRIQTLANEFGLDFMGLATRPDGLHQLRRPRVAIYKSWDASMDEGWTRWLLQQYEFPLDTLHDRDIQRSDLSQYHAVILPSMSPSELLHGHAPGTMPPEYVGGLGVEGAAALKRYAEQGGTILALDEASDFAIEQFGLPIRNAVDGVESERFFIPGSLIAIDVDPTHPVAYGMRQHGAAFFVRSRAFRVINPARAGEQSAPAQPVEVVARYAKDNLLLSGWALGEKRYLAGRPAVVRAQLGEGSVVLTGFRTQFRGQPRNTFKLVFNTLHAATLEEMPSAAAAATDGAN